MAIEFGGGENGGDSVVKIGGGGIFVDFGDHTIDEVGVVPGPAVLKGEGFTSVAGESVNVAIGVGVGIGGVGFGFG